MNSFITKKTVVYTLAIIACFVAVLILFTNTLQNVVPSGKSSESKVQQKKVVTESKKSVLNNFDKQIQARPVEAVEFRGKMYIPPQEKEIYTEEEKIKILNNF
jgi:hypothetical protein